MALRDLLTRNDLPEEVRAAIAAALDRHERAEGAVRESEEKYRLLVENTDRGFVVVDEVGLVLEANEPYRRLVGAESLEDVVGHSVLEWTAPDDQEHNAAGIALCAQQGFIRDHEVVYVTSDGVRKDVLVDATMQDTPRGKRLTAICRDVTDRKRAERELRASHAKLTAVMENTNDNILLADENGKPVLFNSAYARTMKALLNLDMKPGLQFHKLLPPEQRSIWEECHRRVLGGESFVAEHVHELANGERRVFETSFKPVLGDDGTSGFSEITRDITPRKKAEEALRESERRFRDLAELLPQIVYEIDTHGRLQFMNRSGLTLSGYTWQEARVLDVASFVVPLDRERLTAALASVLEGKTVLGNEYTAVRKDGSLFPMAIYSCPILRDGEVVGIRGIGIDISERKAAEEEIRRYAQTQATLLSEVNHRVKNNLSAIIGLLYAERQTARESDSGIPAPAFDDLISRVHGLAAVHEMLSAAEWRALNVAEVVTQVIRGLLNGLPPNKKVRLEVSASELRIGPLMAPKLSLLVNELATNTLKYALQDRHSARIDVAVTKDERSLVLEYRDDGPGYPEDVLAGSRRGAGLYIAETIVRRDLGGEIRFRNEGGAVTVARLALAELGGRDER